MDRMDQYDRSGQNGPNKTNVDWKDRIELNQTKMDWIGPKWTEYNQSGSNMTKIDRSGPNKTKID